MVITLQTMNRPERSKKTLLQIANDDIWHMVLLTNTDPISTTDKDIQITKLEKQYFPIFGSM